ncbi:MAG: hypothetical protein KA764_16570 [Anaerolineales bacterium]|nr:hypothetical protein [Anaerolineales bacterium]
MNLRARLANFLLFIGVIALAIFALDVVSLDEVHQWGALGVGLGALTLTYLLWPRRAPVRPNAPGARPSPPPAAPAAAKPAAPQPPAPKPAAPPASAPRPAAGFAFLRPKPKAKPAAPPAKGPAPKPKKK